MEGAWGAVSVAVGQGWLGKALVALIAGAMAFFAGKKSGEAKFLAAVESAAKMVIGELRAEVGRLTEAHSKCESRLDALEQQGRKDRGRIEQLEGELRHAQQVISSMKTATEV